MMGRGAPVKKIQSRPAQYPPVAIKICGITSLVDARLAIKNGADALGFNFSPQRPRNISVSRARRIISQLPREVASVGVFVNMSGPNVLKAARTARLAAVQLHGDESPAAVAKLAAHFPVIKAFQVSPSFRMSRLKRYPAATAFLFDGFDRRRRGGTGSTFNWEILKQGKRPAPLILAGGLNKKNVRHAVRTARPCAVDVCSGVERLPGRKDARKVREFFAALATSHRKVK